MTPRNSSTSSTAATESPAASPAGWPFRLVRFALWYAAALVGSYTVLIRDTLGPGHLSTPGFVELTTACRRDGEVTLLGILISLTPGTLTLGATHRDDGTRVLWVHSMYDATADEARVALRDMEHRMLHAVRLRGLRP